MEPDIATDDLLARRRFPWAALACAVLVLAGLAAYSDSFHGPFIFDDTVIVGQSTREAAVADLAHPGRRRGRSSSDAGAQLSHRRLRRDGYHVFNLCVHLLAGLALFGVMRRTLTLPVARRPVRPKRAADRRSRSARALLWTVHPLQTEAVTYIIQRMESLMGLFYLTDAVLPYPLGVLAASGRLGMRRRGRLRAGNGLQRSHGLRAADPAALRPDLHLRLVPRDAAAAMAALSRRWLATWLILGRLRPRSVRRAVRSRPGSGSRASRRSNMRGASRA